MFQALYESPWHIPVCAWVGSAIACGLAIARRRMVPFTLFFAVVCALDAWLTGPWTPLAQDSAAMTAAGVTFVIAGDLRFFLLMERGARGRWSAGGITVALALAFIVPVTVQIVRAFGLSDMRKIFLVYELCFFVLALVLFFARRIDAYVRKLTMFEIAQYGLWAGADILLLTTKADVVYGLRMIPNLAYYAVFLVTVQLWAPKE